ncbi:uncharacterized protein LOC136758619 [Amia ocellicauda]|uniref:uncharacterized protein LOC136758619 n=1 Tax=Amia ocellicauda TaxID=2972642 RepID=UPI003464034B
MHCGAKVCIICGCLLLLVYWIGFHQIYSTFNSHLQPPIQSHGCPQYPLEETIAPVKGSRHFMVAAYEDHRERRVTRIIGINNREDHQPLNCVFCCADNKLVYKEAEIDMHSDHFGFPFVTTDTLCKEEPSCNATQVTILGHGDVMEIKDVRFLPIRNQEKREDAFPYEFTVCISNLFGNYNNVLQFIQTIEVYKILGIERVLIYNTSCSPLLEKVLQYYKEEGTLEVVPWPITSFLNPSSGWNFQEHKGDLHYYGQLTTLNDCIYRNMYRTKYLLLNDIDEIIVPYQHNNLHKLMEQLAMQNPGTSVFLIENHIFPKNYFDDSKRFVLPLWKRVPGINIMEHIYREPDRKNVYNPTKMIINPRQVVQTSVHSVLKSMGRTFKVPPDVSRIVHVRVPLQGHLTKEQLHVDAKLWEYEAELIPNINKVIEKLGIVD